MIGNCKKKLGELLKEVKRKKPLVHHLTNYVTVNDCANVVLALGGSPVMADDRMEVAEMTALASSLVLNIGTLRSEGLTAMLLAGGKANKLGIPVILDPVGVGSTTSRTKAAKEILRQVKISVLRGNLAEIRVLAGLPPLTRGVDSPEDLGGGQEAAVGLARHYGCTVAVTGKLDIITDGSRTLYCENGHALLAKVTGTGCMTTSLVAAYCGVSDDCFCCAAAGVATMGLSGEKASRRLNSPLDLGTFRMELFNAVAGMKPEELAEGARIYE